MQLGNKISECTSWKTPYFTTLFGAGLIIAKYKFGWEWADGFVMDFLNSNFVIALTGALAGAFAGAVGAHVFASRAEKKRLALEEIRNTNAAIMITYALTNNFIILKKQHVGDVVKSYRDGKALFEGANNAATQAARPPRKPVEIEMDLRSLPKFSGSIGSLQTLMFEKISISGRPTALFSAIDIAIENLNRCITAREDIIVKIKAQEYARETVLPIVYFGEADENGNRDTGYPDTLDGISNLTDDGIFFGQLLCSDLAKHSQKLKANYKKDAPKTMKIDFRVSDEDGLIPSLENYQDWIDMPVI